MREITQEMLDRIRSPIAKRIWEKWIADGKARLIPQQREGTKCRAERG